MMKDIKLITKDSILPSFLRFDWDVEIDGIPYYVARIPGYVHSIGGRYGCNDLWAWPRDKAPTYETLVQFNCDSPVSWGIVAFTENSTKVKWDEVYANTRSGVTITRNGRKFCHVPGSFDYALSKARAMIVEFEEHPLELNTINFDEHAIGRKVWWRSEPGVITRYVNFQACVIIEPDGIDEFTVPAEFVKEDPDYYCDGDVKTSILDKHIWWFRD